MNRTIRRSSMLIFVLLCMVAGAVKRSMLFDNVGEIQRIHRK